MLHNTDSVLFAFILKESTYFYLMFMTKTLNNTDKATKLAFIFGGRLANCWAQGTEDSYVLATKAGKHFKRCNSHLYKFPKNQKLTVHLFDISNADGWSMSK